MKLNLTPRIIGIMLLSILLSSLVAVSLISTMMINRFKGYARQNERNTAITLAEALTQAAEEDRLEEMILSLSMPMKRRMNPDRSGMRRNMGPMMKDMPRMAGDEFLSILISDEEGRILNRPPGGVPAPDFHLEQGVPFYMNGAVAGYVFVGAEADGNGISRDYAFSMIRGILLSSLLSALMAALLGIPLLRHSLKPLKGLQQGVSRITHGDYAFRLDRNEGFFRDELTRLSNGFNEMARSLEASEEWKKQIVSDTAHELRTPVSLIMGNLEMILEGVYEADRSRLESLYRQSGELADLIRDLQLLALEESGRAQTEHKDFSLSQLTGQCVEDFRPLAVKKDVRLITEGAENLSCRGDRDKTHQVLKNLLANALKFTPSGGWIKIALYEDAASLILDVEDSGPGIPEELRERVFDRFFKVDSSRNSEGRGLGLAISRLLISNQGGSLEAQEGKDGGALFRIVLPINHEIA